MIPTQVTGIAQMKWSLSAVIQRILGEMSDGLWKERIWAGYLVVRLAVLVVASKIGWEKLIRVMIDLTLHANATATIGYPNSSSYHCQQLELYVD